MSGFTGIIFCLKLIILIGGQNKGRDFCSKLCINVHCISGFYLMCGLKSSVKKQGSK